MTSVFYTRPQHAILLVSGCDGENPLISLSTARSSIAMALCLWTGAVLAGDDDAELRKEASARLEFLRDLTVRADDAGIDVARERVTITTAELFLGYAEWDSEHPRELQAAIGAWWKVKARAEQISQELPERELGDVLEILDRATEELSETIERPSSRRGVTRVDSSALTLVDGYYHSGGRPTFPSSFVWMPEDQKLTDAYGEIAGTYVAPMHVKREGSRTIVRYRAQNTDAAMGYVFLGHGPMPSWVQEQHPEIGIGSRHFTAYDIDHPTTREVWQTLLAEAVPQVAGQKISQSGYMLANEPHWFSATGQWDTGPVSDYTRAKFRTWLEKRHDTVAALNQLWDTQFRSFDDASLQIPMDASLRGTPPWYDWCRFNMSRVTDWFDFLKSEIRLHDPNAKVHIKLIPSHFARGLRSHGLDFESLVELQEIIGCDAKITYATTRLDKDDWSDRYACDWRDLAMSYDFFRSVSPEKLLFDSEFHGLSTVHWRDSEMTPEYVRCIYWLAHLHGMGMNQTWYWGRNEDGSPKRQSVEGFYASNLTMPRVMNAFGRTMKELNAFAPEVIALANRPKQVRLFYSETSAIQNANYMDRLHEAYRSFYHDGTPLGFATGQMLHKASDQEVRSWPVLVVPHADHTTSAEIDGLTRYLSLGGTVVVIGGDSLGKDPYGRPHHGQLDDGERRGEGKLIRADDLSDPAVKVTVAAVLRRQGLLPSIAVRESNPLGRPGCLWRVAPWKGGPVLVVMNLGKTDARLSLAGKSEIYRDLLTNSPHPSDFTLPPFEFKLLQVCDPEG